MSVPSSYRKLCKRFLKKLDSLGIEMDPYEEDGSDSDGSDYSLWTHSRLRMQNIYYLIAILFYYKRLFSEL